MFSYHYIIYYNYYSITNIPAFKFFVESGLRTDTDTGTHTHTALAKAQIERLNKPVFFLATGGCTTTCMVIAAPGMSPKVILESASVLLFSKTLPACISFMSFTDFGATVLPVKRMIPLKGKEDKLQKRENNKHD